MTWLQKFFIPADSGAKSAQQLISTVLPFHPLYFPCLYHAKSPKCVHVHSFSSGACVLKLEIIVSERRIGFLLISYMKWDECCCYPKKKTLEKRKSLLGP